MKVKKRIESTNKSLLNRVETANAEKVIVVTSYFDECRSLVEVGSVLEIAVAKGVIVKSEQESWLGTENWNDVMRCYLDIHSEFISRRSKKGIEQARVKGKQIGRRRGTHQDTKTKIEIVKNILQMNTDASISQICQVVGLSPRTFYRVAKEFGIDNRKGISV